MKQRALIDSTLTSLHLLLISILSIFFAICNNSSCLIWGVPFGLEGSTPAIKTFFQWQLLLLPPILFSCEYLGNMHSMEIMFRIRIQNDSKLFALQMRTCITASVLWALLISGIAICIDAPENILVCLSVNIMGHVMWESLFLCIYVFLNSTWLSAICIIFFTSIIFYVGELTNPAFPYLLTSWSMAIRIQSADGEGIPFTLAILGESLLSCTSIVTAINIQRKRRFML